MSVIVDDRHYNGSCRQNYGDFAGGSDRNAWRAGCGPRAASWTTLILKQRLLLLFQMATMMKIVLLVLAAGCVASQSTTDDDELPSEQLQLQIDKLEQHQQQMAQVVNELRTMLADRIGKLFLNC